MVEPEIAKRYIETGQVKLVWRDFAWQGEDSVLAAQAARCAGRQGRFWAYHDLLYERQRGQTHGQFAPANLKAFAGELGLETDAFGRCLDEGADLASIEQERSAARAQGVTATPAFFLNGRRIGGGSVDQFAQAIDAELARLGRSG